MTSSSSCRPRSRSTFRGRQWLLGARADERHRSRDRPRHDQLGRRRRGPVHRPDGALIYVRNHGYRHGPREVIERLAGEAAPELSALDGRFRTPNRLGLPIDGGLPMERSDEGRHRCKKNGDSEQDEPCLAEGAHTQSSKRAEGKKSAATATECANWTYDSKAVTSMKRDADRSVRSQRTSCVCPFVFSELD